MGSSKLVLMEEGLTINLYDEATLASARSADLLSDSLTTSNIEVEDRFLGQNYLELKKYHGQIVQYFKPEHLTLFELAVLAHTLHELNPIYQILYSQCYFYPGLIFAAAKDYTGVLTSESVDKDQKGLVSICGSHLSDRYGHYNDLKVTSIKSNFQVVQSLVNRFKMDLEREINTVIKIFQNIKFLHSSQINVIPRGLEKLQGIKDII